MYAKRVLVSNKTLRIWNIYCIETYVEEKKKKKEVGNVLAWDEEVDAPFLPP